MKVTSITTPYIYKKVYIEIIDQGRKYTKVITLQEFEELKADLSGIATFIDKTD